MEGITYNSMICLTAYLCEIDRFGLHRFTMVYYRKVFQNIAKTKAREMCWICCDRGRLKSQSGLGCTLSLCCAAASPLRVGATQHLDWIRNKRNVEVFGKCWKYVEL